MAVGRALRIIRVTLAAATLTAIKPPATFFKCMVGNNSGGDLTIYSNDDLSEYRVLTTGYERPFESLQARGFRHEDTAFWLYSAAGGAVILEWT